MRFFLACIVVVSALVPAGRAEAQEGRQEGTAGRPYRGLFASGASETEQSLTATASVGAGWDDNVVADVLGRNARVTDVNNQFRGGLGTVSGALSYSLNRGPATLAASAGRTAGYYPNLSNRLISRDYGSITASANLGAGVSAEGAATYQPYSLRSMLPWLFEPGLGDPAVADEDFPASTEHYVAYSGGGGFTRAGFSARANATYRPYNLNSMLPSLFESSLANPARANDDFPASTQHQLGYSAGAGYTRQITRRQTLSASYEYRTRESLGESDRFEYHSAGAGITHALGKGLDLRFGYRYSEGRYGVDSRGFVNHAIDAGVDYNRALSVSRRTTLSFTTGSLATRSSRNESLRYRATGAARLDHEIGRTWNAALSYSRGLQFADSWPEPLFSNSAIASLTGLINRRTHFQFTARASHNNGNFRRDGNGVESYSSAVGLTVDITRHVNTGLTYAYYRHQFGNRISLAPGFPRDLERQSVRGFVSVWVPLFQR